MTSAEVMSEDLKAVAFRGGCGMPIGASVAPRKK